MDFIAEINKIVINHSYRQSGGLVSVDLENWKEKQADEDYWGRFPEGRSEDIKKIHEFISDNLEEALQSDFEYARIFAMNIVNPDEKFHFDIGFLDQHLRSHSASGCNMSRLIDYRDGLVRKGNEAGISS